MKNNYFSMLLITLGLLHIDCGLAFLLIGSTYSNLYGTTKKYAKIKQKRKEIKENTTHSLHYVVFKTPWFTRFK